MSTCPRCKKYRVKRKNRQKVKGVWMHKSCPVEVPGSDLRIKLGRAERNLIIVGKR